MRSSVKVKSGLVKVGLATLCTMAVASTTFAQGAPASPEQQAQQAVDLRQSVFKLIGYSFDPIGLMLKNKIPFDAALAQKSATRLEMLAPMIGETFQTDTRKFQLKTKAREGIWSNKAEFTAKDDGLSKAAAGLSAAAKSGDKKATMQAAAQVGKACGACHDDFRDK